MRRNSFIAKALHCSANQAKSPAATYQNMLIKILPDSTEALSYAAASAKLEKPSRSAALYMKSVFPATAVCLATAAVALLGYTAVEKAAPVFSAAMIAETDTPLAAGFKENKPHVPPEYADEELPLISGYTVAKGLLTISFSDSGAGVDWQTIYAVDENGQYVKPAAVYPDEGKVAFPAQKTALTVYTQDTAGNEYTAIINDF